MTKLPSGPSAANFLTVSPLIDELERHLSGDARAGVDAAVLLELEDGVTELLRASPQGGRMAVLELARDGKGDRVNVTVLQRRRTFSIFLPAK